MDLLDEKGRLFGTVNIIDALVIAFVLLVVAAGATFALDTPEQTNTEEPTPTTATIQIVGVQPYTADAIPEGPIQTESIVSVQNKSVQSTVVVVKDQNGTLHEQVHPQKKTVTFRVTLNTTTTEDDILFRDRPLEVGRQLTLDFGQVSVKGTITNISKQTDVKLRQ